MNIYINLIWGTLGFAVALFGVGIWKKKLHIIVEKINALSLSDHDGFCEFFGKAVVFLGAVTLASAVICFNDTSYVPVSISLNTLTAVYFVLESFHLKKRYS